jgi:hypothetical protein
MLRETFGELSLSWTAVFEWHSQGWLTISWRWRTFRATNHQLNIENVEKIENSSMKTVAKQYISLQTPLGSVM